MSEMQVFKFEVDEDWAKSNNELLRDTRYLFISGVALCIICLVAAAATWFLVNPSSPWRFFGSVGLALFGITMFIVGIAITKSVGNVQSLYNRHPLAPAIIADNKGTHLTLLALVNLNVEPNRAARWAITSRDVNAVPLASDTIGARVPVAAVGGQRSSADRNQWQVITPMPLSWGTPDESVVLQATSSISDEDWHTLEASRPLLGEVRRARNNILPL